MTSRGSAALADRTDCEHRWLINPPATGQVVFLTSDTGIDSENPVELDELDLIVIDPIPSYVWYQDMVDLADGVHTAARPGGGARGWGPQAWRSPDEHPCSGRSRYIGVVAATAKSPPIGRLVSTNPRFQQG